MALPAELLVRSLTFLSGPAVARLNGARRIREALQKDPSLWNAFNGTQCLPLAECRRQLRTRAAIVRAVAHGEMLCSNASTDGATTNECADACHPQPCLHARAPARTQSFAHNTFKTHQSDMTQLTIHRGYIITSSDDQSVKIFAPNGRLHRCLLGHSGGVWTFEAAGDLLLTGSTDKTARLWYIGRIDAHAPLPAVCPPAAHATPAGPAASPLALHTLHGHHSTVRAVKLVPGALITASRDSTVAVWRPTGELRHLLRGHLQSVRCLDVDGPLLLTGSYDGTAKLWDWRRGTLLCEAAAHQRRIYAVRLVGCVAITAGLGGEVRVGFLKNCADAAVSATASSPADAAEIAAAVAGSAAQKRLCRAARPSESLEESLPAVTPADPSAYAVTSFTKHNCHSSIVLWLEHAGTSVISGGLDGLIVNFNYVERRTVYELRETSPVKGLKVWNGLLVVATVNEAKVYSVETGRLLRVLLTAYIVARIDVADGVIAVGYFQDGDYQVAAFRFVASKEDFVTENM